MEMTRDRARREGTIIQRVWVKQTFELSELSLGQLSGHKCGGLATKKLTGKLVVDCNNHTALLTQKRKWTATKQERISSGLGLAFAELQYVSWASFPWVMTGYGNAVLT